MEKRIFVFLSKEHETLLETKELYNRIMTGVELEEMLEEVEEEINNLWNEENLFNLELED